MHQMGEKVKTMGQALWQRRPYLAGRVVDLLVYNENGAKADALFHVVKQAAWRDDGL